MEDSLQRSTVPKRPLGAPASYFWLKRQIDRFVAVAVLLATSPLLLLLAFWVRRDSPGPALFRQTRAGLHGQPFTLLKFRTMRSDADPYGDSPQSGTDARLTRLGQWLRETSLDELPQLINVLRGEMSLVGPRPLYRQQIEEWSPHHRQRLRVPPGLTGLAQIHGRGRLTVEEKLDWDVRYVQRISLRTDLQILWRTATSLWNRGDIYEVRYSQRKRRRSE